MSEDIERAIDEGAARRVILCGTRSAWEMSRDDFRVVCATCHAGGSVIHRTEGDACAAAVRTSSAPCRSCGAS